jgi:hypothetical protein
MKLDEENPSHPTKETGEECKKKKVKSLRREKCAHAGSGDQFFFPVSKPKRAAGIKAGKEKWKPRSAARARDKKTSQEKQNPLQVSKGKLTY